MVPGTVKPGVKRPVAMLNTSSTAKSPAITLIRSKFFNRMTSRMLPAKHILDFCAIAPTSSPTTRETMMGACMLPGPDSENT